MTQNIHQRNFIEYSNNISESKSPFRTSDTSNESLYFSLSDGIFEISFIFDYKIVTTFLSQNFDIGPSLYLMSENGKPFVNICKSLF